MLLSLLIDQKADVNAILGGHAPADYAFFAGDTESLRILLDNGALLSLWVMAQNVGSSLIAEAAASNYFFYDYYGPEELKKIIREVCCGGYGYRQIEALEGVNKMKENSKKYTIELASLFNEVYLIDILRRFHGNYKQ